MAWVASKTWVTGEVLTSTDMNEQVRDRLNETLPAKVTTAGDIGVATGANAIKRLGIGTALQVLRVNSGATDLEWAAPSIPQRASLSTAAVWVMNGFEPNSTQPTPASPWHTANEAMYIPLHVTGSFTITTLEWTVGTTGGTGNYDIGLYSSDAEGLPSTRQASLGSTAYPASSSVVTSNISDVAVTPALYWIGFVVDNATDTTEAYSFNAGNASVEFGSNPGVLFEASAFPLPATATPTVSGTGTVSRRIPVITAWTA